MLTVEDVRAAANRLDGRVHRTPVLTSRTLDARCGGAVFLKCENLQKVGAFKFRGAMNALLLLKDRDRAAGVITHSSGNHGQALACAGQILGIPVCVVMPRTAPQVKREATAGYGARIVSCEPTLAAREAAVAQEIAANGYTLVHPFDNWDVMAGQGTAVLELLDQAGPLDVVVTPIGGGGLVAGTATVVKAVAPATQMVGAEPALADDARRSLEVGSIQPSNDPKTVADGLRTSLGERPWSVIREKLDAIVTASEAEILEAQRFVMERMKVVIEPSSAVAVAVVLNGSIDAQKKRVGVIISGGNCDMGRMFAG
jgi:threonine dehydratase